MNKRICVLKLLVTVLLLASSSAGAQVDKQVSLSPGSPAPELTLEKILQAPDGAKADWQSLRGKVVVIEFWATWCAPCIAVQPHLNELAERFKDRPVQFISITNEDEAKVASFIKRRTLKGWVGLDLDRSAQKAYEAYGIPKTVVVDREGNVAATLHASRLTDDMLDQLVRGTFMATADRPKESSVAPAVTKAEDADQAQLLINIRPTAAQFGMMMRDKGKFMARGADLRSALGALLGTTGPRIFVPAEFQDKHYDMDVRLKDDQTEAYKPLAVSALETALGLKVNRTTREVEAYILTAPAVLTGSLRPTTSKSFHSSSAKGILAAQAADISALVAGIESVLNAPIINETNLRGSFDWDLVFDGGDPASIIEAVRKEFGLELKRVKRQVEVVVVERAGSER